MSDSPSSKSQKLSVVKKKERILHSILRPFHYFSCLSCAKRIAPPPFQYFGPETKAAAAVALAVEVPTNPWPKGGGPHFSNGSPPSSLPGMKPAYATGPMRSRKWSWNRSCWVMLLMERIRLTSSDMVNIHKYSIIYRVSYISGGAGVLPPTVPPDDSLLWMFKLCVCFWKPST